MAIQFKIHLYTFQFFGLIKCDIGLHNLQFLAKILLETEFSAKIIEVMMFSIKFST